MLHGMLIILILILILFIIIIIILIIGLLPGSIPHPPAGPQDAHGLHGPSRIRHRDTDVVEAAYAKDDTRADFGGGL
jgi:hypothetical protein